MYFPSCRPHTFGLASSIAAAKSRYVQLSPTGYESEKTPLTYPRCLRKLQLHRHRWERYRYHHLARVFVYLRRFVRRPVISFLGRLWRYFGSALLGSSQAYKRCFASMGYTVPTGIPKRVGLTDEYLVWAGKTKDVVLQVQLSQ